MIAIDIETTGLDPKLDGITEIAAVRFQGEKILDTFQTLVNPNRPVPQNITLLTGITNEMVRQAPQMNEVIGPLAKFVGNESIVGHNVLFDLTFLRQYGILERNRPLDTYELASVFIPDAPRYNLSVLAQQFGIEPEGRHRALSDSITTVKLYNKLIQIALDIPLEMLIDIVSLSAKIGWNEADILRQIIRLRIESGEKSLPFYKIEFPKVGEENPDDWEELTPREPLLPLDVDEISGILENNGDFCHYFSGYEQRPQQIEMTRTIATAFTKGRHMLIEAGTGTGKSFAYLIPAFKWAELNGERVVISTNTINLQDQLIQKDIPELNKALRSEYRAAVLKGRNNYLCPKRIQTLHSRGPESVEELRVLAKVMVWLQNGGKGDRSEINLNGPIEREIWGRISADFEGCRAVQCPHFHERTCPFFAARNRAIKSHVIIVNHALLLAGISHGTDVIPPFKYLVIDEGHHLENAATNAMSARIFYFDIAKKLQELGGNSKGVMGRIAESWLPELSPSEALAFRNLSAEIAESSAALEHAIQAFFESISEFMLAAREGNPVSVYGQQVRITEAVRTTSEWSELEITWDNTNQLFRDLLDMANNIYRSMSAFDSESEEFEELTDVLHEIILSLNEIRLLVDQLMVIPQNNMVYWIDISAVNNRLSLNSAPYTVGNLIEKMIWHEKESVILTSATLTTDQSFDYLRERLSAADADELIVGSPFDHEKAVLLYIPNDIPEPNQGTAQKMIETTLKRLSKATGGKMLALFTSYAQLKRTSAAISAELAQSGITVFEQGEGASASALLETYRQTDKAILLGTKSFWEGVDIQGEKLSVVVIIKLPFDVPSDPIIAARSESFDEPFSQYSLPEAILKFRQGFGRLIRARSDRGIVVILDNRIVSKQYGKEFLNSIPKCTTMIASVRDLPQAAHEWLYRAQNQFL